MNLRIFLRKHLLPLIPLLVALSVALADGIGHVFYSPGAPSCSSYVIIDVYGVLRNTPIARDKCYTIGMSTLDYRTLGKFPAEKIILITHYFVRGGAVGLGTSDEATTIFALTHPVTTFFVVIGEAGDGREYIAASPKLNILSDSLYGKKIVVITCARDFNEMAQALLTRGAETVVVSRYDFLESDIVASLVEKAVNSTVDSLCSDSEFMCFRVERI